MCGRAAGREPAAAARAPPTRRRRAGRRRRRHRPGPLPPDLRYRQANTLQGILYNGVTI